MYGRCIDVPQAGQTRARTRWVATEVIPNMFQMFQCSSRHLLISRNRKKERSKQISFHQVRAGTSGTLEHLTFLRREKISDQNRKSGDTLPHAYTI